MDNLLHKCRSDYEGVLACLQWLWVRIEAGKSITRILLILGYSLFTLVYFVLVVVFRFYVANNLGLTF